ncbi:MAG: hypothetical protein ACKVWV_01890 [Planctomycetota bacterium]
MKSIVIALIAGSAIGYAAQPVVSAAFGLVYSYAGEVRYELPIDVDTAGIPKGSEQLTETRRVFAVPNFYGDLAGVTQQDERSILWYVDAGGTVRNVMIENAGGASYAIEKRAASRVSVKASR